MRHSAASAKPADRPADTGEAGFINLNAALSILGVIVVAIVGVQLVANTSPQLFESVGNMTTAVSTQDFGDDTTNSLRPIIVTIIALGVLVGVAVLTLSLLKFRKD